MSGGSSEATSGPPPVARPSRRARARRAAFWLGYGLASAALFLGALEWFVRSRLDVFRCDETLGWTFEPRASGYKWSREGEFFQRIDFNSAGFRDVERATAKPPGTFRVLVLGDSMTASLQVLREESFVARVESALGERIREGLRVEVLNAGVDGFGTAQELLLFRDRLFRHGADLVLLQVFMENDLTDNSRAAGAWNHYLAGRCGRPYFELAGGGLRFAAPPEPTPPSGLGARLLGRSQLYSNLLASPTRDGGPPPAFTNFDLFRRVPPPALWASWRLTRELMLALRAQVHASGSRFAVLVVSDKRAVGQVREEERRTLGSELVDFQRGHGLITGFLREQGIPAADVVPVLREEVRAGRPPYFAIDSHLTREGHAIAARAIVEWLADHCAELRVPLRSCPS